MKAFIGILVLVASANAGLLLGGLGGGGGGGGFDGGYGGHGGHGGHDASIIKVIHEEAPVHHAPQIVKVIHEQHVAPAPVVHHVRLIHEHAHSHGGGHAAPEVKIVKLIQEGGGHHGGHHHVSHGWA